MSPRRPGWLLAQLPMGMLDDDFFVRFLSLFQEVATTLLDGADNVEHAFDLTVAPPELVRYLGSWLGLSCLDPSLPDGLQRQVVREAGRFLAWRGTRAGLEGFLEVLTGGPVRVDDSGSILRAAGPGVDGLPGGATVDLAERKVTVTAASTGWLSEEDFVSLVADEIPANVAWTLRVGDRQLWPSPSPGPLAASSSTPSATEEGAT